jgi:lipopolysaccharide transport system ATP-binding protein
LRILNGLIKPDTGFIKTRGTLGGLIALGAGLNPILTGRENIRIGLSINNTAPKLIQQLVDEIIDFTGLEQFIDSPIQSYSSGMQVKLGFAIASCVSPDILILDEVLAVGDAGFRAKCYERIEKIKRNCAVVFVSHSMAQVARLATKSLVLKAGSTYYQGRVIEGIESYENLCLEDGQENIINASRIAAQSDFISLKDYLTVNDTKCFLSQQTILEIDHNRSISLSLPIRSQVKLDGLVLDLVIQNQSTGEVCAEASTFERNGKHLSIIEGIDCVIDLKVDLSILNSGSYSLSLIVASRNHMIHHVWIKDFGKLMVRGRRAIASTQLNPDVCISPA